MQRSFAALESRVFDVLVIGGGITGAGIARDAAMRGLAVAIVDKGDWANGTSSRSSRLVHGGIRYLEHGQLGMVRESVREREILLRIAPHLVQPLEFTWPVYRGARLPKWKLIIGLTVYDMLAGKARGRRHRSLGRDGVLELEPCISQDGLLGGVSYFDAATDDAALTRSNVLSAVEHGAVAVSFARVESTTATGGKADGAIVRDVSAEGSARVRAHAVVSATGPWQAKGTKGSHIVVNRARVGNQSAVTMTSPDDGRVMFVLPSGELTIVGTTDIYTDESPDEVNASEAEIAYLLRAANAYFPEAALTRDDVLSSWAGIRPLAASPPGAKPSSISREHRISHDPTGVIVVTGGKLTTYRSMAAEVVDEIGRTLGRAIGPAITDTVPLPSVPTRSFGE
ncbi:MAG: glycerol-3-phosphate dehydrogenase/oxidase [Gemmatimonadales bacterium]